MKYTMDYISLERSMLNLKDFSNELLKHNIKVSFRIKVSMWLTYCRQKKLYDIIYKECNLMPNDVINIILSF